jgi:hypothetical protein
MKFRNIFAAIAVLPLVACSTGGSLDQIRAKVLNNFQDAELRISPEITRQAKIEDAKIYSPGMVLTVGLDITYSKSCSMLMIEGSFLDKDGTKIASLNGVVQGYEKNQKAHMDVNASKTAPLLHFESTVTTATLNTLKCM